MKSTPISTADILAGLNLPYAFHEYHGLPLAIAGDDHGRLNWLRFRLSRAHLFIDARHLSEDQFIEDYNDYDEALA
jgi:hypothetical protein